MYQALYRKYRPSSFNEVVGQDVIVQTLKNAIKNNKLTHAYLFTGPRGTGKTSTAKILAKTINCNHLENLEPCNQCTSCIQINKRQTTDIIEIDAASNNGVDEIRELKNKVNLVPTNSKYKVYIIDEVHMLSTGAFNALLKTLEEPPSYIIFILATTEPHKIPATILSRCQRFDFKKISENNIVQNLKKIVEKENIEIEEKALKEIALLSQGGMRDSISLLDQAISYSLNKITCQDIHTINGTAGLETMEKILKAVLGKNIVEILNIFDDLDEQGKNMIKLMEEFIGYLRNVLICKIAPQSFESGEKFLYEKNGEMIETDLLLEYIRKIAKAIYEMKNSDNEKITLELNFVEIINLEQKQNISFQPEIISKNTSVKKTQINEKIKTKVEKEKEKDQKTGQNSVVPNQILNEIKNIRINNTLNGFNKKLLLEYKEKLNLVKKYIYDEKYGQWVSLILDGELKAVGNNYLIFVYRDQPMEELFNQNFEIIEQVLELTYSKKIKVVATNMDEWNVIKNEFNSKSKNYLWKEEPIFDQIEIQKKNVHIENEIESMFGDIIEYSE